MTGRHLRFFSRQPYFIGIFLVQPVIWLLLFGALFKNVINIPGFGWEGSYLDYLVPGVLVMTALFSCGWAGMSIIEDLDRSIMARFLVTPIHRSAIIAGLNGTSRLARHPGADHRRLGPAARGALRRRLPGFAVLTLCAMLVGAIAASVSDAMALTLRQRESVIGINTLLTLPLTFLSSAFMPLELAPGLILTVATYNPVNWAVEAGRQALSASPDWSLILPRVGLLAGLVVLTTALATWTFRSYQRSI